VARCLKQIGEIARLQATFAGAGVPFLVMKGVALSQQLYGSPFARSSSDIDLLVEPHDFAAAEGLLLAADYRRNVELTARQSREYRRQIKDVSYFNSHIHVSVELHDRLTDDERLIPLSANTLLRTADEVVIGESPTPTLSSALLPVHLCIHGASHGWTRLLWLNDFAASVCAPGGPDRALAEAGKLGLSSLMLHSLCCVHRWLGVPVPGEHLRTAEASRHVRALKSTLNEISIREFQLPRSEDTVSKHMQRWRIMRYSYLFKIDFEYWSRKLSREFASPPTDWRLLRLPDKLFWLYRVLRPALWAYRLARR
jgi:hypothetical protein